MSLLFHAPVAVKVFPASFAPGNDIFTGKFLLFFRCYEYPAAMNGQPPRAIEGHSPGQELPLSLLHDPLAEGIRVILGENINGFLEDDIADPAISICKNRQWPR